MTTLPPDLRRQLEKAVIQARDVAETAARAALEGLAVQHHEPWGHMSPAQRDLRNRLRALGRQLGDRRDAQTGKQGIEHLVQSCAYEHWHRMLFARFLAENHLLSHPETEVPVSLKDCEELAKEESTDPWTLAGRYAQHMLPQVFRVDQPAFEFDFAREHRGRLEQLLQGLDARIFAARDALGWVYQFWQTKKKDEVNRSEVKIGANELPAVTQLFTEPYMVTFLLDNSIGAWWAARRLPPADLASATSEEELRRKASLPGMPLDYLRFVKDESGPWQPAAGGFEEWPPHLKDFKLLDPCCGSGHFLVAALHMLVPLRMEMEGLSAREAIDAVLRDNLYGLELEQRCVEIAAFALAMEAWRWPGAGGWRPLPALHLACSGLAVTVSRDDWQKLANGHRNLGIALGLLHDEAKHAPILGSLLDPRHSDAAKVVNWAELAAAMEQALAKEHSEEVHETAVAAQGLAKAAQLLAGSYTLVMTNVPYLARGKQEDRLRKFCETRYSAAKNDLATVFLERCLQLCAGESRGTVSIVLPQNWLFLTSYRQFREQLLRRDNWHLLARLGEGGFESSAAAGAFTILITLSCGDSPAAESGDGKKGMSLPLSSAGRQEEKLIRGLDVSEPRTAMEKAAGLLTAEIKSVEQAKQLENPDFVVQITSELNSGELLSAYAYSAQGIGTTDNPRFVHQFWEQIAWSPEWELFQTSNEKQTLEMVSGHSSIFRWGGPGSAYFRHIGELKKENRIGGGWQAGRIVWNKKGVAINVTRNKYLSLYSGQKFDTTIGIIVPNYEGLLPAVLVYLLDKSYPSNLFVIDQSLSVTEGTLIKVAFDWGYWSKVAKERYPNGLPNPYCNDPTQWLFHGHPCGSVVWNEGTKWLEHGPLRTDSTVFQVAVARLLGYRWPAESDTNMELSDESRHWVAEAQKLNGFTDEDGIVCLPSIRGEQPAHERLLALLQAVFGDKWNAGVLSALLDSADCAGKSLDIWLRDKFFEQHCALFHHRPFIWHIWDGLRDGFSALVNYHKMDRANLERLIYTYLGDWIRTQEAGVKSGEDGAEERLAAARGLEEKLKAILAGEKPLDIFVRWKPIEQQSIGWEPDLNDGVRLNIRPFMLAGDVGKRDAGILRAKPSIKWNKDRGKDVASAPWFQLFEGNRINDHHLTLEEKRAAREVAGTRVRGKEAKG